MHARLGGRTMPSGFVVGLVLVAVYVPLRASGLPEPFSLTWTIAALVATLISPVAGLTVLAAIGPFTEALGENGRATPVPFLLAALGVGTTLRVIFSRPWPRPNLPLVLGAVLLVGTATGVAVSALAYGSDRGVQAAELWVPSIGGAMTVLLAAAWASCRTETRPLFVAAGSLAIGASLALLNMVSGDFLRANFLGWMLRADIDPNRLGGLIPAPNAAAAIFLVGLAVSGALALMHPRRDVRVIAAAAALIHALAIVLTFSRSGLLGAALIGAVFAWQRWRRVGVLTAVLVVMLAVGLPIWMAVLRDVPIASDEHRITAWVASLRIWLDHPIVGAGFRSFEWLHGAYGSPLLDAPHNEWLRLFAEEGTVIGVAGLVFALATPISLLRVPGYISAGAAAAAAALFMMAIFNNQFLYTQVNVPGFLVIGTGLGLALRRTEGEEPPPLGP